MEGTLSPLTTMAAPHISALILAGGKATRLGGAAKHELVVAGRTILSRQHEVLAPRVAEILIATPADIAGYRCVRDVVADAGPLAGVAAGMAAASTPWLLVVAGDMPALSGAVIDLLISAHDDAHDAVAFRIGGLPEPLLCVLHTRVAPAVARRLAAHRLKAAGLLTEEGLAVRWIDEAHLRAVDPELRSLANVNSPADLPHGNRA